MRDSVRLTQCLSLHFNCLQFPGPLLQVFQDRAAAEDFIANAGRMTPQPTTSAQDDSDDEFVERARIFNGLDPNSELARRRTLNMTAERKEAQRKSRLHIAMHLPILRQESAVNSPPLSIRSIFPDAVAISPIEDINGFGSFPSAVPLQSMTLLPVKHLASSIVFYAKVLGFTCVSQVPDVQAVMASSAASICLRSVDQAPPSSTASSVSRMSLIRTNSGGTLKLDPLALGRPALPTMSEEHPDETDLELPPTPESLSLSCTEPDPLQLPITSLPLRSSTSVPFSGSTVLIEYSGALESMHTLLSARLNEWRLERAKSAPSSPLSLSKSTLRSSDNAGILGGVQQTLGMHRSCICVILTVIALSIPPLSSGLHSAQA